MRVIDNIERLRRRGDTLCCLRALLSADSASLFVLSSLVIHGEVYHLRFARLLGGARRSRDTSCAPGACSCSCSRTRARGRSCSNLARSRCSSRSSRLLGVARPLCRRRLEGGAERVARASAELPARPRASKRLRLGRLGRGPVVREFHQVLAVLDWVLVGTVLPLLAGPLAHRPQC